MNDPFALLGLGRDAGESDIKRAYAQRLRKTRPDDDPEGFQQLNAAYQAALAYCRRQSKDAPGKTGLAWSQPVQVNVHAAQSDAAFVMTPPQPPAATHPRTPTPIPAPLPFPQTAPLPQAPSFNVASFMDAYRQYCLDGNAQALSRWLTEYPAFWHIPTKQAGGRRLLQALFEQPVYMSEACFDATSDFFHFNDTLAGIDPLFLQRVRARGVIAWLVRPENHTELASRIYGPRTVRNRRRVQAAIKHATGPFRWWHDLPHTLRPRQFTQHMGKVLVTLCGGNLEDLPPPIDPEHARFWIEAASAGPSRAKTLVYAARSMAALVLIPLATGIFGLVSGTLSDVPNLPKFAAGLAGGFFLATASVVALIWLAIGCMWLEKKLEAASATSRGLRVARFCLTPMACGMAILIGAAMDPVLGTVAAIAVMFVAFGRSRSRHGSLRSTPLTRFGIYLAGGGSIIGISALLGAQQGSQSATLVPVFAVVVVTLIIWARDWYRRGFLHPRSMRSAS